MSVPSPQRFITIGRWALGVLLLVGIVSTATYTGAQTQRRTRSRPTKPRKAIDGGASADAGEMRGGGDGGEGKVTQKTTDGGTRVFRFGEMEIEGRLKNPQLVFFLRRVRAEFAAGDLGHRSFLRELGETKLDPNF